GWNDAPQCARQSMHNPIVRKQEMRWLQAHGVAGIKVDFFAGDKQETLRLYEAILSDANDFGIQVIFHGCTLPRGWEKMYPNYCGSEAVLASENLVFNQHFCDMEAQNACLHPFVRNTVGSMEFGGTFLQRRLNRNNNGGTTRRTSDVFELATAIAFQSSGQNFALTPRNLTEQPAFEIDFMKQVPTTWDETRFIDGFPGKYLVMARRHADRWYIVAMNAQKEAQSVTLEPRLLGDEVPASLSTLLHDGADGNAPQQSPLKLDKKGCLSLSIPSQCAAILF
nr:glycoside hydrolase family 97 catalytic domain-containing protein [Bacteroidaceae bacterium]